MEPYRRWQLSLPSISKKFCGQNPIADGRARPTVGKLRMEERSRGLLKDGEYSSPIEGKRSLGSLIEEFDLSTAKFLSFGIRVTFKMLSTRENDKKNENGRKHSENNENKANGIV
ncbi:hypothetical protein M9H77_06550 [Catharanthus roseus]|uniref:Uncharacterized protein n=1 Tax=Catharanthus roseus TaxID=4058 RepID=A0ACC0BSJ3_CATRO|nr:hypothetical protein M9H77_06550 [Catharanthus roseus]